MASNKGRIGTPAETAVVKYLQMNGFPHAERRALAGAKDKGDILACPGLIIEVKAGNSADRSEPAWLADSMQQLAAEISNSMASAGLLVTKRNGYGTARVGEWWAWGWAALVDTDYMWLEMFTSRLHSPTSPLYPVRLRLADAVSILRRAGFGNGPGEGA